MASSAILNRTQVAVQTHGVKSFSRLRQNRSQKYSKAVMFVCGVPSANSMDNMDNETTERDKSGARHGWGDDIMKRQRHANCFLTRISAGVLPLVKRGLRLCVVSLLASGGWIHALELVRVGTYDPMPFRAPTSAHAIAVEGTRAYLSCEMHCDGGPEDALLLLDITDPTSINIIDSWGHDNYRAADISVNNSQVVVALRKGGASVVNAASGTFVHRGYIGHGVNACYGCAQRDGLIYYAANDFVVYSSATLEDTDILYLGADVLSRMCVVGDFAYYGTSAGINIINVSDPSNLAYVGTFAGCLQANDIDTDGTYLYVSNGDAGLSILTIRPNGTLTAKGVYNTESPVVAVGISGTIVYAAERGYYTGSEFTTHSLMAFDASNPASPTLIHRLVLQEQPNDLAVANGLVYLACNDEVYGEPLQIFELSTARPANDDFANAISISGSGGQTSGSNAGATLQPGEPDYHGGQSVWWRWTAPANGTVTFDTFGSDFDTKLAAYTGGSVGGLAVMAYNDDAGETGQSEIQFSVVGGTTYRIAVGGWSTSEGNITLNWYLIGTPVPPTGVSATDGTYTDRVRVTWSGSSGATAYEVWRHTSNSSGSASKIGDPASSPYDDTTAVAGTTYYYWVKARNAGGASGFSLSDPGYKAIVPTYTVSYNANGATSGTAPGPQTKIHDQTLALASNGGNLAKTGYTFSGWNTAANGSGTSYAAGGSYTANASVTLYARWTPITYTVAYNGNGNTGGSTANSSHTYDVSKALTANGFTRTGHTFAGWATTANGAVAYSDGQSVVNLAATQGATVTLYAKWTTVPTYAVTYNANGATSGTAPGQQTKIHDQTLTLASNSGNLARTGYTFAGWNTAANGSGTSYAAGGSYTANATVTLYAKWTSTGIPLATALDNTSLTWTTGGDANWFGQTATTHDGMDAAQSGGIGHSQASYMQTTVTGPGTVSFWWRVSSESSYDWLRFFIGDVEKDAISGSVDWQQKRYVIPSGNHTLTWRYTKDYSCESDTDCGWVDQVVWDPEGGNVKFFEDWESGQIDTGKWKIWGSPAPTIVSGGNSIGNFALTSNGDSMWESGVTSLQSFEVRPGFTVSAKIFVQSTGTDQRSKRSWHALSLTSRPPAEWGNNHGACDALIGPFITLMGNTDGGLGIASSDGELWCEAAPYLDRWTTVAFIFNADGSVTYHVDGQVFYTTSAGWIDYGSVPVAYLVCGGRSEGESVVNLHDDIIVQSGTVSYLNVSPTTVSVPQGGGSVTFEVSANVSWSVSDNASWLAVSPSSGSNNGTVTVTATSSNTETSERQATVTVAGGGISRTVTVSQPGDSLRPVHRFWSPVFSAHFFTINETEKNNVIRNLSQYWTYEGVAYYAYTTQVPGTVPLYRFWSPVFSGHFFTINETEKNNMIRNLSQYWTYEGVANYVYPSRAAGTAPVYRFWSPVFSHHFYTINETEKNNVIRNLWRYWDYETVAFYAIPTARSRSIGAAAAGAVVQEPEDEGAVGLTGSMAGQYVGATEPADDGASAGPLVTMSSPVPANAPLALDVAIPLECPGLTVWAYARAEGTDEWRCILDGAESPDEALLTGLAADSAYQVEIWAAAPEGGAPFRLQVGLIEQTTEVPEDVFELNSTASWFTPGVGNPLVGLTVPDTRDPLTLQLASPWEGALQSVGPAEGGAGVVFELPACNRWYWIGEASEAAARVLPRWLRYKVAE